MSGKTISLRHGHVQAALADLMRVKPDDMPAFQARLRHFRNIGVPSGLPEVGRGGVVDFTRRNIFELFVALEMHKAGLPPKHAALFAVEMMGRTAEVFDRLCRGDDIYAILYPSDSYDFSVMPKWDLCDPESLPDRLKDALQFSSFTVLNLSSLTKRLTNALLRVILGDAALGDAQ